MATSDKPIAAQPPVYNFRGIKVNKCWITRKETASFTIDGQTTYFESSIGIGVESDNPEHTSRIIYEAAHRSLNVIFEQERKNWLSAKIAEAERIRVTAELHDLEQEKLAAAAALAASAAVSVSEPVLEIPASAPVTPAHLTGNGEF